MIMKLIRIQILIVLFFISFLAGCKTYDYGVNKKNAQLPYRTYYYNDKDKNYDFNTVLYSRAGDIGASRNYVDFNIHIGHLQLDTHRNNKGMYVSEIFFDNIQKANVIIDFSSIKLYHYDKQGAVIAPFKLESQGAVSGMQRPIFKQVYDPCVLPDAIIETVYIELSVDGKKIVVNERFQIEKTLHYTFWDVLMGV